MLPVDIAVRLIVASLHPPTSPMQFCASFTTTEIRAESVAHSTVTWSSFAQGEGKNIEIVASIDDPILAVAGTLMSHKLALTKCTGLGLGVGD